MQVCTKALIKPFAVCDSDAGEMQKAYRCLLMGTVICKWFSCDSRKQRWKIRKLNRWKDSTDSKGLKVNMNKTRVIISGESCKGVQNNGRWSCSCGRCVGRNSIQCTNYQKLCTYVVVSLLFVEAVQINQLVQLEPVWILVMVETWS